MVLRLWQLVVLILAAQCLRGEHVVTDDLGRRVSVVDHPHRLIALVPSVADILFSLGHGADVAGVSEFTNYPAAAKQKPHVGLPLTPDLETILALHPDLVIGIADLNTRRTVENLERVHLSVVMVSGNSLESIYRSIETIGNALNDGAAGKALNGELRSRVERLKNERKNKPRPTVLFPIWADPLIVAGKHAFVTELIEIAGGDSITADLPQDWTQTSVESLVAKQPQMLILPASWPMSMAQLAQAPGWRELVSVRENRVVRVDERMELPSPAAFDALEDLAKQLDRVSEQEAARVHITR